MPEKGMCFLESFDRFDPQELSVSQLLKDVQLVNHADLPIRGLSDARSVAPALPFQAPPEKQQVLRLEVNRAVQAGLSYAICVIFSLLFGFRENLLVLVSLSFLGSWAVRFRGKYWHGRVRSGAVCSERPSSWRPSGSPPWQGATIEFSGPTQRRSRCIRPAESAATPALPDRSPDGGFALHDIEDTVTIDGNARILLDDGRKGTAVVKPDFEPQVIEPEHEPVRSPL